MTDYITLTIDDKTVQVPKGTTVYEAAKQLGIELPIFCYHDRMPPFGACRVCLVEVEKMAKPQTSCTLVALEGMVVRTQAAQAVQAREEILEFLLINHPLDCPICDRGGECPLQDQALQFGPGKSRFFEDKRHFVKPYPLGPVLTLDRERCVVCARCTRFGDIVAGDHALEFIERGYKTEVGTADGGTPKSKFIGNTIQICPVGALTSSVYRFRARPWDNLSIESSCTLCPVGCSMILDSRDGEIMRTRSNENRQVNDIWLCDKGWFGYEFSSSSERLTKPLIKRQGKFAAVSWDEAFSYVAAKMREAKASGQIGALGGNVLTVEENYLLQKLMRDCLGSNHLDTRVGMPLFSLDDEGLQAGMMTEIGEVPNLSHVVLLGLDITEEFPVIWLQLKLAINKGAKVLFYGHFAPEIARYLEKTVLHEPGVELKILQENKEELKRFLQVSPNAAVFVGRQYLATAQRKAILAELLSWQGQFSLNIMEGKNNSLGARLAGMHPELLPHGKRIEKPGLNAVQMVETIAKDGWDLLYVVGADVASKFPTDLWNEARKKLGCLIVQDLFMTKTCEMADVVLPTLSYVEKGGSFLNIEHRIQKLKPGKSIHKGVYADSYIFVRLAQRFNQALVIDEPFLDSLKPGRMPLHRPQAIDSQNSHPQTTQGDFFATFSTQLFDHGVRMQHNTQLVQLAKGPRLRLNPIHGFTEGQKVTLQINGKTISATIQVDARVAPKCVVIPLGFAELAAHELAPNLLNGLPAHLQTYS